MKLIYGDALDSLQDFKDIDLILTDPPYNVSIEDNHIWGLRVRQGLDFGEWDAHSIEPADWIPLAADTLSKNGSMIVFCGIRQASYIIDVMEKSGLKFKDTIRWIKTNPMPRNRDRRYVVDYEFAVWGAKGKWTFHRQNDTYDRPEIRCSYPAKRVHPTQKPVQLMEDILRRHSNPGDTVLDPFMGSGTTGIACQNLGREFIGIEKDCKFFESARKRLGVLSEIQDHRP